MRAEALEPDRRLVHRLESFSDIVIGFSLAQLGLNLVIPVKWIDVFAHPVGLTAFVVTFVLVCRVWWAHHTSQRCSSE